MYVLTESKLFQDSGRPAEARRAPLAARVFRSLISPVLALQAAAHRHPHRVSAAVLVLLGGSAVTAFGVAPLASLPDAKPTVTQLIAPINSPLLSSQLAALDDEESQALRTGLEGARLKQERRALRLRPALLQHQWLAADVLELSFALPPGCYATAVLHELGPVEDASQA